jgi:SAM-dependent methyltransferase
MKKIESTDKFHQDNAAAWDVTAAIYERDEQTDVEFLRRGGSSLMPQEQASLGDLSGWCQRAIHLECAGGTETLSLLRQGAQAVIGIDISPRMIACARRKAAALAALGSQTSWYCCDVLAAPPELDATADLVHTGRGALNWMMDLDAWARVVFRLLKPGGKLHVFEGHPLDWVWDVKAAAFQLDAGRGDYFAQSTYAGEIWPKPFIDRQVEVDPATLNLHDHPWTLGQILNSVIRAGLRIEYFNEYPQTFWDQFPDIPPETLRRLPHTFTLLATKDKSGTTDKS